MDFNRAPRTVRLLEGLPLFAGLGRDELDRLALNASPMNIMRGETIFRSGEPADGFYVIVYGQVKLVMNSDQGQEKVLDVFDHGMSFGHWAMFAGGRHVVAAVATQDTLIIHVDRGGVMLGLRRIPGFAEQLLSDVSSRVQRLVRDLESVSLYSGTRRVINYLLSQSRSEGRDVSLTIAKATLASRLSLTAVHFSRILKDLVSQRLIEVHGRTITLLDTDRLQHYDR